MVILVEIDYEKGKYRWVGRSQKERGGKKKKKRKLKSAAKEGEKGGTKRGGNDKS